MAQLLVIGGGGGGGSSLWEVNGVYVEPLLDRPVLLDAGTITASQPSLHIVQVWNDAAVAFNALTVDIASIASLATSTFARFLLGSVPMIQLFANGTVQGLFGKFGGNTVTANEPALTIEQTWNNGSETFTALSVGITSTAAGASSRFIDLTIGGVSAFRVFGNSDGSWSCGTEASPYLSSYRAGNNGGIEFGRDGVAGKGRLSATNTSAILTHPNGTVGVYSTHSAGRTVLGIGAATGNVSYIYGSEDVLSLGSTVFAADRNNVRDRDGTPLYILGGDGGATNRNGGSVYLDGGLPTGSGVAGDIIIGATRGLLDVRGTDAPGADPGSLMNAPKAGNPDFWPIIKFNGTRCAVPAWIVP